MRRTLSAALMVAQLGGGSSSSGTGAVSPAVMATTMTVMNAPGAPPGARRPDAVPAQTFIRRASELVSFLQCDVPAPDASAEEQKIFDMWCSWVTGP